MSECKLQRISWEELSRKYIETETRAEALTRERDALRERVAELEARERCTLGHEGTGWSTVNYVYSQSPWRLIVADPALTVDVETIDALFATLRELGLWPVEERTT